MGNEKHGFFRRLEKICQPGNGINIQMVGWFVQKQKISIIQENLSQLNTTSKTPWEVTNLLREVWKTKLRQYCLNLAFNRPSIQTIHLSHNLLQASLIILRIIRHKRFILTNQGHLTKVRWQDCIKNCLAIIKFWLLSQISYLVAIGLGERRDITIKSNTLRYNI